MKNEKINDLHLTLCTAFITTAMLRYWQWRGRLLKFAENIKNYKLNKQTQVVKYIVATRMSKFSFKQCKTNPPWEDSRSLLA